MTIRPACLLAMLAAACAPALATPVYKCVSDGGKVTYSQNPCYGENWHRFGEQRAPRRPAVQPAAPATAAVKEAPGKAAADMAAADKAVPTAATAAATAPAAVAPVVATAPATSTRR